MPRVKLSDGTVITMPDNPTADDIAALRKAEELASKEAVQSVGESLNSGISAIPRQLGLTARHALTGLGGAVGVLSDPIASTINLGVMATGREAPLSNARTTASGVADWLGLPKPETPTERVVGDASELLAGVGTSGAAGKAAQLGVPAVKKAGDFLTQSLLNQLTAATGAGLAGGSVKEAGGGAGAQFLASMLGGVVGGAAPNAATGMKDWITRLAAPKMTPQQIDLRIERLLSDQGIDWKSIPAGARMSLRRELGKAVQTGDDLNADAVRRLLDYRTIGATPTRGTVTLDPVQITREKNLAKLAANSGQAELHGLPKIQNDNNKALIQRLNEIRGAEVDQYTAGKRAVDTIAARDAKIGAIESGLYKNAREAVGREIPLNREQFVRQAYETLAKENKGAFLPDKINKLLEQIRTGKGSIGGQDFDVPFNVDVIDNLKTTLAKASRSSADGNERAAIGIVRNALENAQPTEIGLPAQAMGAFDAARKVARARRQWWESSPAVSAAVDGVAPDQFVKKFVISDAASFGDVTKLAKEVQRNPQARDAIKSAIAGHLKEKALSGAADEVGNFSAAGYNRALKAIDKKLSLFFSAEEVAQLKALGRVASYELAQPRGSAVNNSNTAGMMLGRGLDMIMGGSKFLPFGKAGIADPLTSLQLTIGNRAATNVMPGLLAPQQPPSMAAQLAMPAVLTTGLLSSP